MTLLKLSFAGKAMKVEHKMAGDKPIIEVSLCRKQKGRGSDPETFCWIRVTIWQPPEFMSRLAKGMFIGGVGELSTRSYEKDGQKHTSLEVRCGSFDVEIGGDDAGAPAMDQSARPVSAAPRKPATSTPDFGDVPF